jgi:opacity protein-like surface antigen
MPARASNDGVSRVPVLRRFAAAALFAALLTGPLSSFGQSRPPAALKGFTLGGLFPSGDFNAHVGQDGVVLGLYLALRVRQSPAFVGFELSASYYGHVHRHAAMDNIPEVVLEVDTYNNIVQGLFFARLQPRISAVTPYLEAMAGLSYIYTDTTVSDDDAGEDVSHDINFGDWTVTAGAGAGFSFLLNRRHGTFLDFKVRYMAGGQAAYLKQGGLIVDGDRVRYYPESSGTSFITVQAGLTWFF